MRNKLLCWLLCLTVLLSVGAPAAHAGHAYTVAEAESLCGGIVGFKSGGTAQDFIDGTLCDTAGVSAEFYIIALSQSGSYRFSAYEKALLRYLKSNEIYAATSREKYALALIAAGSNDRYISQTADEAIGGQGLMSLVFGLHILNNGYQSKLYSVQSLVDTILSCQLSDGGWAVIGSRGDADVTAMVLQSLAPYYRSDSRVTAAVDRALTLLSSMQQPDGGYLGMGVENCESAAQVLCALSDLRIDANTDQRFIKNGCSVFDALVSYRNADGSFAHTGSGFNETATMEAFYAVTAYLRFCRGQGSLYVLDNRRPATVEPAQKPARQTPTQAKPPTNNQTKNKSTEPPSGQTAAPQAQPQNHAGGQNGGTLQQPQQSVRQSGSAAAEATEGGKKKETASGITESAETNPPDNPPAENEPTVGAGRFQPSATASPAATADEAPSITKGGYKPAAIAVIAAAALIAALILFLLKKRNKKHYIAVGILAAAGILFVLLTNFESTESYRTAAVKADPVGAVTLSIRCDTLSDEQKPDYLPDDCVILDETAFAIAAGDTVYDILLEASKQYGFPIDNRGTADNAYIAGVQYLYEYDWGELSGWMYKVNGEFPDVGCQSCVLHDGDRIEWLYTRNIGKDL